MHRLYKRFAVIRPSSRAAIVLLMLVIIPLNAAINIKHVKTSVTKFNQTKAIAAKNGQKTGKVLGVMLNAEKLMDMMQGEKRSSGH